jgi:hypothetical protein
MKIGDKIYFVSCVPGQGPRELEVAWIGMNTGRFMASDYTFMKPTPGHGDACIGIHRTGLAWISKEAYETYCEKRDAWESLCYAISRQKDAPDHLSADEINQFIKKLKKVQ